MDATNGHLDVLGIMIDCSDPEGLATFWAEMLGVGIADRLGDPPQFVYLEPVRERGISLYFQRVPEAKTVKNRLHLDVHTNNLEVATGRIKSRGGRRRDDHDFHDASRDEHWRRMADPEGNEFCLVFDP